MIGKGSFRIFAPVMQRIMLILLGGMLFSLLLALFFGEDPLPFALSAAVLLFLAALIGPGRVGMIGEQRVELRQAYLLVLVAWLTISIAGSLPYIFSGDFSGLINAIFESTSGFTTTGSSILTDIEGLPRSILFWRSLTHWIGGIGIIVLVILVMPRLRLGAYQLFTLESSFREKIQPKIRSVGQSLLFIYIMLTAAETVLLAAGKMSLFESVCHAFGTVATGGFSPLNSSIAGYSPYIQYVVLVFMLLSGTNYLVHYYILKRDLRRVRANDEFRFYLVVTLVAGLLVSGSLWYHMGFGPERAFREGMFQVVSIITTTGYATADYLQWSPFAIMIIFLAMFLGGSTGSTSGGIKMARHLVLVRNIRMIFMKLMHPNAVSPVKLYGRIVGDEANSAILAFFFFYILYFVTASLVIVAIGVDPVTAGSAVATCLAGIGPGLGTVGPVANFAHLPGVVKIILSITMIVGRLEVFPVLILLSRSFWKE